MKHVLVINYSQTGQLSDVSAQVVAPLRAAGHAVHVETLVPETPFPWPWPIIDFVDAFPECVQLDPPPLKPLTVTVDQQFDPLPHRQRDGGGDDQRQQRSDDLPAVRGQKSSGQTQGPTVS